MKVRVTLAVLLALFGILTLLDRFVLMELLLRRAAVPMLLALAEGVAIIAAGALMRRSKRLNAPVDFLIGYPVFGAICFLVGLLKISTWTMVPLLVIFGLGGVALLLMWFAEEPRVVPSRVNGDQGAMNGVGQAILPVRSPRSESRKGQAGLPVPHQFEGSPSRAEGRGSLDFARDDTGGARDDTGGVGTPIPMHRTAFLAVATVLACGFVSAFAPPSSSDETAYHLAVPQTWVLEGRAIELPLLSQSYFPLGIESADLPLLTLLGATGGGVASHFLHLFAALALALAVARRTRSWLAAAAIVTTPALAIAAGWSLIDWPLAGLFVILWTSLEDDDVRTASAATAAGLLVKYTFLPFALIAWACKRRMPSWIVLVGLIFFARNAILTGNPVAPFFSDHAAPLIGQREPALADYIFQTTFIDEALGASLLILVPFATGLIPLATLVAGIALFVLAPSARILVPFLVVPALSAASALKRRLVAALVVIAVIVQTLLVVWFTGRSGAFSLLAGKASHDEYLAERQPSQAAVMWLNETLPPRSRTLVIGLNETYWLAKPVRGGDRFDGPRLSAYLDVPVPEALRDRLRRDGITHVAVVSAVEQPLSPAAQKMLVQTLDRYASNVVSRENAALFTLR